MGLSCLSCTRREPPAPPPPPPPAQVDRELLAQALHECFTVDCERGHEHAAQIAADSPLRQSDEFHAIAYRYDAERLLRAESQLDVDKRRAMLDQLRGAADVDVAIRSAAAERLARLGGGLPFELGLAPDAGVPDAGDTTAAKLAELMRLKTPEGYQAARALLEPRIYSGKGSPSDIAAMTTVCKAQKDTGCLKNLKTLRLR